jgi:hypothetical protein
VSAQFASNLSSASLFEFNTRDTCYFRFILNPFEASNRFQGMPCFAVFNSPFNPFLLPFVVT